MHYPVDAATAATVPRDASNKSWASTSGRRRQRPVQRTEAQVRRFVEDDVVAMDVTVRSAR
ncbi:MAG: hypothetical protein R3C32_05705 [Chloroflexota bacterium]